MQGYLIREHGESDTDGILSLFRASFNKETSAEWLKWKYRCPWGAKGYVALHDGQVVAFYGGLRLPFGFRGKTLWAYQLCDVMTHPHYRGRLIAKTPLIVMLGETLYRENTMDFAFGFPSLRHARLQALRLGGEGYRLVRVYRKEQPGRRALSQKLRVREGWTFLKQGAAERLIGRNHDTLRFLKDDSYIRWRFQEQPSKKYDVLAMDRFRLTKGYIIFAVEDGWLNIMDIFYRDVKDAVGIMTAAEAYAADNGLAGVKTWCHPAERLAGYLEGLGYTGEDHIPLAFKAVNVSCGVTSELFYNSFLYRMGDYDAS